MFYVGFVFVTVTAMDPGSMLLANVLPCCLFASLHIDCLPG